MTGKDLEVFRKALHMHPGNFAQALGYTQAVLKKKIAKFGDGPITEVELMKRIAYVVPRLALQRIEELHTEIRGIQELGPRIEDLSKRLAAEFKQERWKERFDNPAGATVLDTGTSQAEGRMVEELTNEAHVSVE